MKTLTIKTEKENIGPFFYRPWAEQWAKIYIREKYEIVENDDSEKMTETQKSVKIQWKNAWPRADILSVAKYEKENRQYQKIDNGNEKTEINYVTPNNVQATEYYSVAAETKTQAEKRKSAPKKKRRQRIAGLYWVFQWEIPHSKKGIVGKVNVLQRSEFEATEMLRKVYPEWIDAFEECGIRPKINKKADAPQNTPCIWKSRN